MNGGNSLDVILHPNQRTDVGYLLGTDQFDQFVDCETELGRTKYHQIRLPDAQNSLR